MEDFASLFVALGLMLPLAAIGLTTVAAFVLMPILGLVSEWSFRRIFFTSFLIGLLAPIIAGVSLASSAQRLMDGRDMEQILEQVIPGGEERIEELRQAGERGREIVEAAERGEITEEQAKEQLEQLFQEETGFQVDLEDVQIEAREGGLRIETE